MMWCQTTDPDPPSTGTRQGRGKFHLWLIAILGSLLVLPVDLASVHADPPSFLTMFRKKKPITDAELPLRPEHGPWLILATTLTGPDSAEQATTLAKEIRQSMRLPAYVLEKSIGGSQTLGVGERLKTDEYGREIPYDFKFKYANSNSTRAYAVLVGEFTSTEDPRIEEILQRIRTARPKSLVGEEQVDDEDITQADNSSWVQKYRSFMWKRTDNEENQRKGPMGVAFVTRNPLLPDDFFQAPKVDDFVAKLNKDVEHSLLDCPSRYTVRVASFQGKEVTDFGNSAQSPKLDKATDSLDKAAWKAHKLTTALRKKGVEAYEFHDRYGSYVTIGSFDTLGQQTSDSSQFQYSRSIMAVLNEYCGYCLVDIKDSRTGQVIDRRTSVKSLDKVPFDIEGKPMAVPREATANIYSGSLLGGR